MNNAQYIQELVSKAAAQQASAEELDELVQLIREDETGEITQQIERMLEQTNIPVREEIYWKNMARQILNADKAEIPVLEIEPYHKVRTAWLRYAAAIIILIGISTFLYINNKKDEPSVTQTNPVPVQNDVAPGGNKATLTLADGSKITLDDAKTGELAREENTTITKTADGKIIYDPNEKLGTRILYNTMATPRGGQYQLTLPDGSQVWLNAESSITYPTAFTGNERKVSVTGEAYFEVTSDKRKPFLVECYGAGHPEERSDEGSPLSIEVLGTHFNVNTYREEPNSNITLLEGRVRIKSVHTSLTLKPGQQGQLSDRGLSLAANPDIEQAIAWKNGLFVMKNTDVGTIMREIVRWYDVEVVYEGEIPAARITGDFPRRMNLSGVLQVLELSGIKLKRSGRKITVLE